VSSLMTMAGLGHLLQAGGQMGGIADRGVVHAEVIADGTDDDEPGMDPQPQHHRNRVVPPD
jgi:hypothetical protein